MVHSCCEGTYRHIKTCEECPTQKDCERFGILFGAELLRRENYAKCAYCEKIKPKCRHLQAVSDTTFWCQVCFKKLLTEVEHDCVKKL